MAKIADSVRRAEERAKKASESRRRRKEHLAKRKTFDPSFFNIPESVVRYIHRDDQPALYWVYFIRAGEGPVKIGFSENPLERMAALQTAHWETLELLGAMPAIDVQDESALHKRYARYRIRGEWFHPADVILDQAANYPIGEPSKLVPYDDVYVVDVVSRCIVAQFPYLDPRDKYIELNDGKPFGLLPMNLLRIDTLK